MKLTDKQIFITKMTLGIIFAIEAGEMTSSAIIQINKPSSAFALFLIPFFPLVSVVVIQWVLLSDHLPKWWIITGVIGCFISAFAVEQIHSIFHNTYDLHPYSIEVLKYFVRGTFATILQWVIIKNNKGYLWSLGNGIGWALTQVYSSSVGYFPILSTSPLVLIVIIVTSKVPLGLIVSLGLYKILNKSFHIQIAQNSVLS